MQCSKPLKKINSSIFMVTLKGRGHFYPHFTVKETEAQRKLGCPTSHSLQVSQLGLEPVGRELTVAVTAREEFSKRRGGRQSLRERLESGCGVP